MYQIVKYRAFFITLMMATGFHPIAAQSTCVGSAETCTTGQSSTNQQTNVRGKALTPCSKAPLTGWYRDGFCKTDENDRGRHVVCAQVTKEFLEFSKSRGNDLMTAAPRYRFPGLKPGDSWCLCAVRWKEAFDAKKAPPVVLSATNKNALQYVSMEELQSAARRD